MQNRIEAFFKVTPAPTPKKIENENFEFFDFHLVGPEMDNDWRPDPEESSWFMSFAEAKEELEKNPHWTYLHVVELYLPDYDRSFLAPAYNVNNS